MALVDRIMHLPMIFWFFIICSFIFLLFTSFLTRAIFFYYFYYFKHIYNKYWFFFNYFLPLICIIIYFIFLFFIFLHNAHLIVVSNKDGFLFWGHFFYNRFFLGFLEGWGVNFPTELSVSSFGIPGDHLEICRKTHISNRQAPLWLRWEGRPVIKSQIPFEVARKLPSFSDFIKFSIEKCFYSEKHKVFPHLVTPNTKFTQLPVDNAKWAEIRQSAIDEYHSRKKAHFSDTLKGLYDLLDADLREGLLAQWVCKPNSVIGIKRSELYVHYDRLGPLLSEWMKPVAEDFDRQSAVRNATAAQTKAEMQAILKAGAFPLLSIDNKALIAADYRSILEGFIERASSNPSGRKLDSLITDIAFFHSKALFVTCLSYELDHKDFNDNYRFIYENEVLPEKTIEVFQRSDFMKKWIYHYTDTGFIFKQVYLPYSSDPRFMLYDHYVKNVLVRNQSVL